MGTSAYDTPVWDRAERLHAQAMGNVRRAIGDLREYGDALLRAKADSEMCRNASDALTTAEKLLALLQ